MSLVATHKKQTPDASSKRLSHVTTSAVSRGLEGAIDPEQLEQRLRSEFDLETKYGPVVGLTRMERWERAVRLGLDPPTWVRDAIQGGIGTDIDAHLFTKGKV